jgi:hypothetical protein
LGVVVVNKPGHSEFQCFGEVWAGVSSTVAVSVVDVKSFTTVQGPDRRGRAAALASAKDREFIGMRIGGIGDAELGFDLIDRVEEHISLDVCNVVMQPIGSGDDT